MFNPKTPSRRQLLVAAATLAATAWCSSALAQPAWPSKPVKIMVGFPGGSTPDMAARALAEVLAKSLGQPVVVENKPGASGDIAADQVAKAGDDHTLGVVINGNLTSAKLLKANLPYDPAKDFAFVSLLATAPLVLAAQPELPAGADFFAAARASAGKWSYGSVGIGSVGHLGMEYVKSRAGNFDAVHVPYNGNPAVITAILGGQVQMALMPPGIALPQVKAGKMKAIGLTGPRSPLAPDTPSLAELGVQMDALEVWVALVGPASLSASAQDRLAREVPAAVNGEARERLLTSGWQAVGSSSDGLRQRVARETGILGGIIQSRGIKIE
ncbi:MAG: tripartite tricarboxylate transporter substrate binding protein [Rubrivivax sp.]|jgi:tripartite-type tricarboxylate transporter receptor subunit TctC|nr:tripartite tricarboxylate transporter substrate binding protein [Betaproteobacteria bacterium]MBK9685289.1 tripartite tricarboxylate transporter substrate binding protein [Betaproteobacteria bacterium]MBP6465992.1 tripartite tricarboxylate transporter substrate binding protein [Rubrivivax sp.]